MFEIHRRVCALALTAIVVAPAMATDVAGDPIVSVPGRMVCQSRPVTIDDKSIDAKL